MTLVMVVDDHELLADSLQAALTVEGLEVVRPSSFDASVLLAEAAEWSPQLVLLDLGLPDDQSTLPMVRPLVDLRSEEHTSELQSLMRHSYALFCLNNTNTHPT